MMEDKFVVDLDFHRVHTLLGLDHLVRELHAELGQGVNGLANLRLSTRPPSSMTRGSTRC
jgi:hypothetical protein